MKRLNIVVPYRDRAAHLTRFVPHLRAYFERDKADSRIPYRVLIVEQDAGLPFNHGALANIGFLLGRDDSDYTCFHDVDYLPIWADYSWTDSPTALLWYGAETRPVSTTQPNRRIRHNLENYYGGVTLVPNALFEQVDGFACGYWGWGFEDIDFKRRLDAAGIEFQRRKGTFQPLDHDNAGFAADGRPSPAALANQQLFEQRWREPATRVSDGLSTLAYTMLDRRSLPQPKHAQRPAQWELVKVKLSMSPAAEISRP